MIKKTVLKLLRAIGIAASLLVTALCVAGYLALQEPEYYAAWRSHQPTAAELAAATASVESERAAYLRWRSQSLARIPDAPAPDAHEVRFTDADLNVLLATEGRQVCGGRVEVPRVRVTQGRVDIAFGVQTAVARCVLSAELAPSLSQEGVLILEVRAVRLGQLPLPHEALAQFLPRERHRLSGSMYLDLAAPKPRLTIDLSDQTRSLLAESLECEDGRIAVRFVARPSES